MSRSGVQRVELQAHNIERRSPFPQSPLGEIHTTRAGPAHSAWPHPDDVLLRLLLHCVWRPQAESPAPGGVCHPHTPSRAGGEECLAELFYIGIYLPQYVNLIFVTRSRLISILACKVILSNQMILSQFCCGLIAIESPKLRHALPLSARCSSLVSGTALPHASAKDSTGRHHQPDPGLHHPQDSPSRAGLLPAVSEIVPQPQPLDVSDQLPQ